MDLEKYRALWHEDFVGWPLVNSEPVRKDRIIDWMKGNTSRGLKLQSYAIEQLAIKVTADIAINHYRIKLNWARSTMTKPRGPTHYESRTPGSALATRGKLSAACRPQ
ncbi:MAG TPA: hypothetical protein VJ281_04705 [Chthoniobacterales bacterium]|nr:hypothetical protein [Chthoniobacterales bacterium]